MLSSVEQRLQAARHYQWVGRDAERSLFRSALEADKLPFCLLYIYGPGGVGKTTLLNVFAASCHEHNVPVMRLDGRSMEATPDGLLQTLRLALNLSGNENPVLSLSAAAARAVLLVDTYEALDGLDGWMRESFLPGLPENVLVVLSGRTPPSVGWRSDPGWQEMLQTIPLRNLSPDDSRAYLLQHSIPLEQHAAILNFTHGYPLALSLVADVFAQKGNIGFDADSAQDVVQALLERLVPNAPDSEHRAALETCALVHLTTEPLLAELNPHVDAPALFAWLRGLSFMEAGWRGLFPHDVAREALLADLRWRNPDRYFDLHRRARAYYAARLNETQGQEQQRILLDFIFLHRDNAVVRSGFQWQDSAAHAELAKPEDWPALTAMTTRHEGVDSARILNYWLAQPMQKTFVFRDAQHAAKDSDPLGFLMIISVDKVGAAERQLDPAVETACRYLEQHAPLRAGESALYYRFWMAHDTYQDVSLIQSLIVVSMVRQDLTTPGLAYTFFPCRDVALWTPIVTYAQKQPLPEAEFAVEGRQYGVFGHDWRVLPPTVWLSILAEQETGGEGQPAPRRPEPLLVLSEAEFGTAVREAMRHLHQPEALRSNPLLRSRLVFERVEIGVDEAAKADALCSLIREAAHNLLASPRLERGYLALHHTYLHPAPTQEQAADLLQLPFSTYRRHLAEGIVHVIERLWRKEIGENGKTEQKLSN